MQSSPKKGGVCLLHTPRPKLLNNSQPATAFRAPEQIWFRWEREAGRLFSLFWATANAKHLAAFANHVYAMRGLAGRRIE